MKAFNIGLIVLLSFVVLFLTGILVMAIRGEDMIFKKLEINDQSIKSQETNPISDINEIVVSAISGDVFIFPTDEKEVKVVHYSTSPKKGRVHLTKEVSGQKLIFKEDYDTIFGFNFTRNVFYMYLPVEYCNNLKITTVSADVNVKTSLCSKELSISTTSGEIEIENKVTSEMNLKTVSGEVFVNEISGNSTIKTTSGDIEININNGNLVADSISGEIDIQNLNGSGSLKTTSGNIEVEYFALKGNSIFKTVSGNVATKMLSGNCEIKATSTSGRIKLPNGSSIVGVPPYDNFEIKTTSGNINIK